MVKIAANLGSKKSFRELLSAIKPWVGGVGVGGSGGRLYLGSKAE